MKIINILEHHGYNPKAIDLYKKIGRVIFGSEKNKKLDQITTLVTRLGIRLDKFFLINYPKLEVIITCTTGLDHIDIEYCKQKNITVISLRDCYQQLEKITSTAELALGLIISLVRFIPASFNSVIYENQWNRSKFIGRQLNELTLGVLGYGRLGKALAKYASALNMQVSICDTCISQGSKASNIGEVNFYSSIIEMSSNIDILSIHVPLDNNIGLINQKLISNLKKPIYIVNTSRGLVVDEDAICDGLKSGIIKGYATDVLSLENSLETPIDSKLVKMARDGYNVIVTPHIGGATLDAMMETELIAAEYYTSFLLKNDPK